jgi:hypothetical protein
MHARVENLRPAVRDYVRNLEAQARTIERKYGAADAREMADILEKMKPLSPEARADMRKVVELGKALVAAGRQDRLPKSEMRKADELLRLSNELLARVKAAWPLVDPDKDYTAEVIAAVAVRDEAEGRKMIAEAGGLSISTLRRKLVNVFAASGLFDLATEVVYDAVGNLITRPTRMETEICRWAAAVGRFDVVEKVLQQMKQRHVSTDETAVAAAREAGRRKNLEAARSLVASVSDSERRALKAEIHLIVAQLEREAGQDPGESLRLANEYLLITPLGDKDRARLLLRLASELVKAGDLAGAEGLAGAVSPHDRKKTLLSVAKIMADAGKFDEARDLIERNPDAPEHLKASAYFDLAYAMSEAGHEATKMLELGEAMLLKSAEPENMVVQGEAVAAYAMAGKFDKVREALGKMSGLLKPDSNLYVRARIAALESAEGYRRHKTDPSELFEWLESSFVATKEFKHDASRRESEFMIEVAEVAARSGQDPKVFLGLANVAAGGAEPGNRIDLTLDVVDTAYTLGIDPTPYLDDADVLARHTPADFLDYLNVVSARIKMGQPITDQIRNFDRLAQSMNEKISALARVSRELYLKAKAIKEATA